MERDLELPHGHGDIGPIADINVTPFIDIMLVLLIIFMVTAPLMLGGVHINLPKSGGTPMPRPDRPLVVSLNAENRVFVGKEEVITAERHEYFKQLARDSESGEVYVRGDGEIKYGRMMELMGALGQAGFARVTLVTSVTNEEAANSSEALPGPGTPQAAPASSAGLSAPVLAGRDLAAADVR